MNLYLKMDKRMDKYQKHCTLSARDETHCTYLSFVYKHLRTPALKSGLMSCHAMAALADPLH